MYYFSIYYCLWSKGSRVGRNSGSCWCGWRSSAHFIMIVEWLSCEWIPRTIALRINILASHFSTLFALHISSFEVLSFCWFIVLKCQRVVRMAKLNQSLPTCFCCASHSRISLIFSQFCFVPDEVRRPSLPIFGCLFRTAPIWLLYLLTYRLYSYFCSLRRYSASLASLSWTAKSLSKRCSSNPISQTYLE